MTLSIAEQETFKVRIERLESDVRELSSSQKTTLDLLQEVRESQIRVETTLAVRQVCPAPGSCVKLEKRIDEIERITNQAVGMGTVAKIAYSALGGAVAAPVVTLLLRYLTEKH